MTEDDIDKLVKELGIEPLSLKQRQMLANKRWKQRNPGKFKTSSKQTRKKYRENNQEKVRKMERDRNLQRYYGLTQAEYDSILKDQNGVCKICESNIRLVIDHCHYTKKVRGILCHKCNVGIGALQDSPRLLLAALIYLLQESDLDQ